MVASCDNGPSARNKALKDEVEQLGQQHFEAQQVAKRLQSQLDAARLENQKLQDSVKKAEESHDAARKELEQMKKDFEAYKAKYKVSVRSKVPGLPLADFSVEGRAYRGVVAMQFTEDTLGFNHAAGTAKVLLTDLPDAVRDVLGLTAVHDLVFSSKTVDSQPVSVNKVRDKMRREIDQGVAELDDQAGKMRDEVLAVDKQLGRLFTEISIAKAKKRETFSLEKEQEALKLRKAQLQAELLRLDVQRHELGIRRSNIR